jgi:hypothetical protein
MKNKARRKHAPGFVVFARRLEVIQIIEAN